MGCAQSTQQGELGTVIKDGHAELLRQKLPGLDDAGLIKALHKAVKHFQPACVEVLLQSGANAAAKDQDGHNVFHILVMELGKHSQRVSDAVEVVNVLGKHLGNTGVRTLDVADKDGTPLLLALANKQEALARAFMAVGCSPTNATNSDKSNALHLAIMSGNPGLASDVMKAAEKQFVLQRIVNQPNMQGISPLHRTVAMKMGDTADELLALPSINVNAQDAQGNTPLHATYLAMLAVPNNPAMGSMARKFLGKGAAIDLPNRSGQTCFSLAVDLAAAALDPPAGVSREALLEPLAAMAEGQGKLALDTTGAVFNAQGMKGLSAVHVAALLGDVGMLSGLINRGADVNVHNLRGQPASMLAAQAGQKSLLVALFGPLGADPLCMDRQGTSPVAQLLMTSSARLPAEDLKEVLLAILESPNPNVSDIQRLSSQPATTAGTPTLPGPLPLLHLACALGRLEVVQQLVNDAHMPPDAPSSDRHMTPLAVTVAAYCASPKEGPKFLPIAEFLVKQGANPVARDQAGATPLGRALDEGHLDLAMALIRHARQHVDFQSPSGSTALYVAILQGARPAVEELVTQLGASVRPQPRFTPLHVAVGSQQPAVAQFLLTQPQVQESMNQPDCNKMTALGYLWTAWQPEALSKAHAARLPKRGSADLTATQVQLAQMLLAQPGCDPNAPDASGKRLLHLAVEQNRVALIKTLARTARGLDPNLPDSDGVTPLYRAVQKGDATLVEALTTSLPKLDVCAPSRVPGLEAGRTPLQAAVASGNVALCALLVDQPSVRLDMPVFKLCMGLLDAKPQVCEAILGQLLHPSRAAKCSIDLSVAKACTFTAVIGSEKVELPPLHYVARLDKAKLVELLVKQGKANVNATDNRGLTALHHAVACKAITAANALVNAGADVSALGNAPTTPLIAAATSLDVALVALLLGSTKQYNVNATDGQGHTALSSVCQMLLEAPLERPSQSGNAVMQGAPSITSMASMKPSMTAKSEMMMASPHNVRVELAAYSVANPPLEAMSFASTSTESFASVPAGHRNPSSQASLTSLKDAEEIVKLLLRKGADPNHAIPPSALRDISRNLTSQITSLASSSALLSPTRRPLRSAPSAAWKSPGLSLSPAPSLAASSTSMDTLGLELFTPLLLAIQLRSEHVLDLLLSESPGEALDLNGAQGRSWPAVQVAIQVVQLLAEELAKVPQERSSKPAVRDSKSNLPSIFARFLKDPRSGATLGSHEEVMEAAVRILNKLLADPRVDLSAPGDGMLLQQVVEAGGPYTLRILRMLMTATGCKRADINAVNPTNGTTVLHTAAAKNEREVVELLAKAKGVHFNLLDKEGHTPLAAAVQAGARDAIATLLQHGLTNEYAAGPLDPLLCGDDPSTSPMALAIAHPEHRVVHALVSGLAYANLSHNTSVVPHHNHKSSSDLKAAAKDALSNTNANGSAPAKYDIEAVLNNPIDKAGRAPVLVATKALKLDHAQVLVKTERQTWPGAALDVTEPEPLIRAGSTGASAANGQAADAEQSQATPLHLVLEHIITLDAQAKSKTKGGEARQLLTRAAVLASDMASAPSMARAVGLADAVGFTPLHWAVMARLEDVVQILCPKARKLGSINAAADTEKGQGFTALHLAAKLNLVTCAHYLLLHAADASLTMRDGKTTALMMCASEEMRLLLLNPPAITVQVDTGNGAPVIKKRGTFASGYDNFTGQLAYTWNQVKGGGTNGFQKRSSTAKVDGNKVVIEDPEAAARARQASKSLYQSFRTALEVAKSAGQALGPLGAALVAVCSVADQLLEGVDKLVFSNMIVSHICGRIKRQVPTLQALRKALEQSKSEEAAQQLLPHVANLGEVYIKIHRMVEEWSVQGKAALVARVFASQDFWEDLMEEERMLTGCMTDLGTAVNALNLMGMKVNVESVDPEQAKEEARAAIRQDMQMAMAHILEVEAMSSDVAAAHAAATRTFKQYGLDYNKLKRKERRRWRTDKLRDLIIPAAELQIVAKIGTGGSAQVFRAMYQGYPVAYKQFEALPNQGDLLREGVENEAYIMSMLRHPNVIQIFGMVADKDKNSYGLVVDYHAPGSLQNMIDSRMHAEPISIQERVALVLQIARGMAYLHGRSIEPIVHGDLKPSNVLISEDGRAVITDFGMSRVTSNTTTTTAAHQTSDTFTSNASAVYTAPEVVGLLLEGKKRPPSSDVFSFGVLCLELLTLQPCYTGFAANPGEYSCKVAAGQRPSIPTELPQVLRECIEACWDHEPAKRPAFDEVVEVLDYVYASVSGGAGPAA